MKGTYCLIIGNYKTSSLKIGNLYEDHKFKKGFYVYIGSAMNSLVPRLNRHLSDEKKMHWHKKPRLPYPRHFIQYFRGKNRMRPCRIHIKRRRGNSRLWMLRL